MVLVLVLKRFAELGSGLFGFFSKSIDQFSFFFYDVLVLAMEMALCISHLFSLLM
ncbi:hypothetical protein LguiA_036554 [Lonicera macranthoides]